MASTSHDNVTYTVASELAVLHTHMILPSPMYYNTTITMYYNSGHIVTSPNIATSKI